VVRALATGRDEEVHQVLTEIRHAAAHPETSPQHLIIYGERGSGKSFLLRMVELEVEHLARAGKPPDCLRAVAGRAIQYQIVAAIAGGHRRQGARRGLVCLSLCVRYSPGGCRLGRGGENLHEVLDQRFGPGRGLVVAMIENFDALAKRFSERNPLGNGKKKGLGDGH